MSPIDEPNRKKILRYQHRHFYGIFGWCRYLDGCIFREILLAQARDGISASLAEIGVFQGKSFFILALAKQEKESCLAIDLFAEESGYTALFRKNCRKAGVLLDEKEMICGDASLLTADDVISRGGKWRMVSIDGGHDYDNVMHNLNLADAVGLPEIVMALDDVFNVSYPEVGLATFDWLRERRDYAIIAATQSKAYLCRATHKEYYSNILEKHMPSRYQKKITGVKPLEQDYIRFKEPAGELGLDLLMHAIATLRYKNRS